MDKVKFITDNGTEEEYYIEDQTRVNGTDYLLVSDSDSDTANALILKNVPEETGEEAKYAVVTDDDELKAVLKVFQETLDEDTKIEF